MNWCTETVHLRRSRRLFQWLFAEKVLTAKRDALPTQQGSGAKICPSAEVDSVVACLETFESENSVGVRKLISQMKMMDPLPASLLRDSLPVIIDILNDIINVSLESGVTSFLKKALIQPLLKNTSWFRAAEKLQGRFKLIFFSKVLKSKVSLFAQYFYQWA